MKIKFSIVSFHVSISKVYLLQTYKFVTNVRKRIVKDVFVYRPTVSVFVLKVYSTFICCLFVDVATLHGHTRNENATFDTKCFTRLQKNKT